MFVSHLTIVTCNVQFTNWATCYNRLSGTEKSPMDYRALIQVWLIYQIWRRFSVSFSVVRDKSRNIDIEEICASLYPKLRQIVDNLWINHNCQYCSTRLVVLDGDAKAYRTVCSFQPKKVIKSGHLNEFIECARSPLPGKDRCHLHIRETGNDITEERLDFGTMTRSRRKELGIDVNFLTTEEGCRKRENITQRTERSKTAGMIYCYRWYFKTVSDESHWYFKALWDFTWAHWVHQLRELYSFPVTVVWTFWWISWGKRFGWSCNR